MRRAGLAVLLFATAGIPHSIRAGSGVAAPVTDEFVRDAVSLIDDDEQVDELESVEEIEVLGSSVDEDDIEDPCDSPGSPVAVLLNCIRAGTWTERLEAVEWLPGALGLFDDDPGIDQQTLDDAIDLLIQIVHDEPDDWIARSLLYMLDSEDGPGIARLFRAALREASINVQAAAVRHLGLEGDPEAIDDLERLWRSVVPDWLRRNLIVALAEQPLDEPARRKHLSELIDLTTHADPEIRLAAIEALGTLGDAAAEPALLRAARHGNPAERSGALHSLGDLPVTDESMAVLERAVRSEDVALRRVAVGALGRVDHPRVEPLLLELVERSSDETVLLRAVEALEGSEHPDATASIAGLLARLDPSEQEWLMGRILRVLHNREDADALAWLGNLPPETNAALGEDLIELVDYLSGDRSDGGKTFTSISSCGLSIGPVDPGNPRARRIAPRPPFETVRCWEAPSVAGESWLEERPTAGTLVEIDEHFERPEATWVQVSAAGVACWVPLTDLVPADTPPTLTDPTRLPRFEFDLPAREADSRAARHLIEAGLMQILEADSHADMVAAALSVDPADPDQVALLEAVSTGSRGALDRAIARLRRACCVPLP